jgi:hypothetical protein
MVHQYGVSEKINPVGMLTCEVKLPFNYHRLCGAILKDAPLFCLVLTDLFTPTDKKLSKSVKGCKSKVC